jgi:hypothetical protein
MQTRAPRATVFVGIDGAWASEFNGALRQSATACESDKSRSSDGARAEYFFSARPDRKGRVLRRRSRARTFALSSRPAVAAAASAYINDRIDALNVSEAEEDCHGAADRRYRP